MDQCNVIQTVSKYEILPSYLECFEPNKIHLIFAKKPSVSSINQIVPEDIKAEVESNESLEEYDLTGSPLQTDLGGNDTIPIFKIDEPIQRWTAEESKHFPLPVREARRLVNRILKNVKLEAKSPMSTYVVCNADDSKKTVLLGGNAADFMACSIHAVGTVRQIDVEKKIDEIVDDHLKNCHTSDRQVKYLTKTTYNLYGKSFRNISCQNSTMRQLPTHGHVYAEIVSQKKTFMVAETDGGNMKMYLEIIAGHKLLRLNFIWEVLVKLQSILNILSDRDLSASNETVLCEDPLNVDEILQAESELLSARFLRPEPVKNVDNLENLRQDDFLDGLWKILIRCGTLSDLSNSFNFLFDKLAEGSIRVLPIKDDCSKVSTIIKGILQGKIDGVSTISFSESIELLFELGAQKLKFDFQAILKQFIPHINVNIDSFWRTFFHRAVQETKNPRRTGVTRVATVTKHFGEQDIALMDDQLSYLSQLYIGSEFIYLLKDQVKLSDDGFRNFCLYVEKEYVSDRKHIDFNETFHSPLNHMSFDIDLRNASFIQSAFPSRSTMSMETGREITIYDLADSPIFPPVIYDYGMPISDNEDILLYYISKMSRSTGLF